MEFRLLGAVQVTVDGHVVELGGWQRRALLAMLLLHANRTVPADRLVAMLWPAGPPRSAARNLQVRVSQVRRLLTDGRRLAFREPGYRLKVLDGELDLHRFERLVDHGRQELAAGRAERASNLLAEGLALWRGGALEDVSAGAPVLADHRDRLEQRRLAAVEDRIEADLALGRHADLVGELTALVADHPLRERTRAQLMRSLTASGRPADALAEYRAGLEVLRDTLGLDPGPLLRQAERVVLAASAPAPARAPADRPRPSQLPADIPHFVGRATELAGLDAVLAGAAGTRIAVVSGTAGVGKTALAVHWAHRSASRFPDGHLYVDLRGFDATGHMTLAAEAVCGFLEALDVPAGRVPVRFQAQVGLYRSLLSDRRMLVLLDNARDVEQVRHLLPGSGGCLVVVTSRCELPGLTATVGARPITLDLLPRADAARLLAHRIGPDRVAARPRAIAKILDHCAGLPLALAIVAARAAARPGLPLDTLTDGLNAFATDDAGTDLRTVFSWSCRAVSGPAARLFRLLGIHPGPDIGVAAAASLAGIAPAAARAALDELTRANLLTEPTDGRFTCHDLLRTYTVELSRAAGAEGRPALRRLLDHYCLTAGAAARLIRPGIDPIRTPDPAPGVTAAQLPDADRAMSWFDAESVALPAVVDRAAAAGFDTHVLPLARALTDYFDRQGRLGVWLVIQRTALAAARRLRDRTAQARALWGLAKVHSRTGRDDDALHHLHTALRLQVAVDDRDGQGHTHLSLAMIRGRAGRLTLALAHAERALALFRQTGHLVGAANALNSVGFTRAHLGDHWQAVASCRRAVLLLRRLGDQAGEASAWDSIGFAFHRLRRHRQAVRFYGRALRIYREIGDHRGEADTLIHLGDHDAAHAPDAARRAWRRAADLRTALGSCTTDIDERLARLAHAHPAAV
jgi:DNA-binding SARP family transcriptional activator/tetratricopeptide (TPR) repeat protein